MGVAPGCQRRLFAQVFITHVVPADKAGNAVHHHDFAMVTKVDLETVKPAAAGGERFDFDPGVAQRLHVTVGQGVAADAVVEHMNIYAFGSFFLQQRVQLSAKLVVMNDEKLEQHCSFGIANGVENRAECGFTIDQQPHFIIGQARHAPQFGHGAQGAVGAGVARGQGFFDPWAPVQLVDGGVHFLVGLATGLDVRIEGAAAEDQVRDQRQVRHEHQRQGPGDRALGGPDRQYRVDRRQRPEKVQRGNEVGEQVRAKKIHERHDSRQSSA
ncbi:hypothetical protein [Pseudomonas sp. 22 E 5]|nr:hypothetical protein [Pseudomonas sp. 22 E 5]